MGSSVQEELTLRDMDRQRDYYILRKAMFTG